MPQYKPQSKHFQEISILFLFWWLASEMEGHWKLQDKNSFSFSHKHNTKHPPQKKTPTHTNALIPLSDTILIIIVKKQKRKKWIKEQSKAIKIFQKNIVYFILIDDFFAIFCVKLCDVFHCTSIFCHTCCQAPCPFSPANEVGLWTSVHYYYSIIKITNVNFTCGSPQQNWSCHYADLWTRVWVKWCVNEACETKKASVLLLKY